MPKTTGWRSPGGKMGWRASGLVGRPAWVEVSLGDTFWQNVGVRAGPAPVRDYLPDLLDRVWSGRMEPGKTLTGLWTNGAPAMCSSDPDA
jgi:hypothetical protein